MGEKRNIFGIAIDFISRLPDIVVDIAEDIERGAGRVGEAVGSAGETVGETVRQSTGGGGIPFEVDLSPRTQTLLIILAVILLIKS